MARYKTKYAINQKVEAHGLPGMVTAIHIRNRHRAYEFSYVGEGGPTSCNCEEGEIKAVGDNKLGF